MQIQTSLPGFAIRLNNKISNELLLINLADVCAEGILLSAQSRIVSDNPFAGFNLTQLFL
ncbi:MAG: hypothetical protein ABIN97_21080 [Ginsengibacter sp.]